MPTTKKRLHITLPPELEKLLPVLAKRDNTSEAGKAVELLKIAIELEEDESLNLIAQERDTDNAHFIAHEDAWAWVTTLFTSLMS